MTPRSKRMFEILAGMKRDLWLPFLLAALCSSTSALPGLAQAPLGADVSASSAAPSVKWGDLALSFEPNLGQEPPKVRYLARGTTYTLYLTNSEMLLNGRNEAPLTMTFVGANPTPRIVGEGQQVSTSNYLIGNDPGKWRTSVPNYERARYASVYPGIDLVFYGHDGGDVEYDWIAAPSADPRRIRLRFDRAARLRVDSTGDLVVELGRTEYRQKKPIAYQNVGGKRIEIAAAWRLHGKEAGFRIGRYDRKQPLIIDPTLYYSTYLGGSNNDYAYAVTVDNIGNTYVTGGTGSADFPTASPLQSSMRGSSDVFVTKVNAAGTGRIYSTFLGSGGVDEGRGIGVNALGEVYVTGSSGFSDFPMKNAIQSTWGGSGDAFLTKLDSTGSSLVYSTYLGGNANDYGTAIALDSSGSAYVTGVTFSPNFPTVAAFQAAKGAQQDAFVAKINPSGSAWAYVTYLGGNSVDEAYGIAVDTSGNAYLTGWTQSTNFPVQSAFQSTNRGGVDGFVAKLNPAGSALVYSTYLGGTGNDTGTAIAVDAPGSAYVTGLAASEDFPLASAIDSTLGSHAIDDVFITKFNPAGSALVYSTFVGGASGDDAYAIAIDKAGNAYVTGRTNSSDYPLVNPIQVTRFAFDMFVTEINASGSALLFSTFVGGSGSEAGRGIAIDSLGNIHVAGESTSTDFPAVKAIQTGNGGNQDAIVLLFADTVPTVTVTLDRQTLAFSATSSGSAFVSQTAPQVVSLTQSAGPSVAWTATSDKPWLVVTPTSGTGSAKLTVSTQFVPGLSATQTGTITIAQAANRVGPIAVTLNTIPSGASQLAFGQVDTPVQNATSVQGAIGVTGWALDDIGISGVRIYRNCLPFDVPASCQVILGNNVVLTGDATFVAGVRPDVEAAFSSFPQANRAGWGFLLLTNMLPHVPNSVAYGGQGPLTLYVFATDVEGNVTLLGRSPADHTPTAIIMANDTIAKPFGAIDTPGQGATVSGTLSNFGWVLTPDSNTTPDNTDILIPPTGSTMNVFIDGVAVGTVGYNNCRGTVGNPVPLGTFCNDDIANIFGNGTPQPALMPRAANVTRYRNLDAGRGAIGLFSINTTALTNGLHSIAWGVSDSAGRVEGIGSRNFIVLNSGADALNLAAADQQVPEALAGAPAIVRGPAASLASLPPATGPVWGRTGFDLATAFVPIPLAADGAQHIGIPELGRLELTFDADVKEGYLVANGTLRDLPAGSHLDPATGQFTWAPGPGYIGTYRLTFVRDAEQIPVHVTIRPAGTVDPTQGDVRMHIDAPGTNQTLSGLVKIAGWALDPQAAIGSGIDAIHVWAIAEGTTGTTGKGETSPAQFLGAATLDGARPDVAQAHGAQFDHAGYWFTTTALAPGQYSLIVHVHSTRTGRWEDARSVRVTIR